MRGKNGNSNDNNKNFVGAKRIFIKRNGRGYLALFEACKKYNPDDDPNGAIGHGLAEAVHSRTGGLDISKLVENPEVKSKVDENRAYLGHF